MPAALARRRRELGIDIEEARAGYVTLEIELATPTRVPELPAAVDELVAQAYQLPGEGGSATEGGWIT